MSRKPPRREHWGTFESPQGDRFLLIRGNRNVTQFETPRGTPIGPVQSNVVPAYTWAEVQGWKRVRDADLAEIVTRREADGVYRIYRGSQRTEFYVSYNENEVRAMRWCLQKDDDQDHITEGARKTDILEYYRGMSR